MNEGSDERQLILRHGREKKDENVISSEEERTVSTFK